MTEQMDADFHTLRFVVTKTKDCGFRVDMYGLNMKWMAGGFCDERKDCITFIGEQFLIASRD